MISKKVFGGKVSGLILTVFVCALWGSLYPSVKLAYNVFGINSSHIPTIVLFGGVRFVMCGAIMVIISSFKEKKI